MTRKPTEQKQRNDNSQWTSNAASQAAKRTQKRAQRNRGMCADRDKEDSAVHDFPDSWTQPPFWYTPRTPPYSPPIGGGSFLQLSLDMWHHIRLTQGHHFLPKTCHTSDCPFCVHASESTRGGRGTCRAIGSHQRKKKKRNTQKEKGEMGLKNRRTEQLERHATPLEQKSALDALRACNRTGKRKCLQKKTRREG